MTEIKVTHAFTYEGEKYEKGTVVDLPDSVALSVVEKGYGEETESSGETGEEIPVIGEEEPKETERSAQSSIKETEDGLDVSNYRAATFISADDVEEGDELTIEGSGWKDDRFDQEYLYLPVTVNGQEFRWRVNKTNAQVLSEAFGNNTGDWEGETVVVDKIRNYPGVNKEGFVVKPSGNGD